MDRLLSVKSSQLGKSAPNSTFSSLNSENSILSSSDSTEFTVELELTDDKENIEEASGTEVETIVDITKEQDIKHCHE